MSPARYDTKRVIARYFEVKMADAVIEDHDGDKAIEKWVIPEKKGKKGKKGAAKSW